MNLHKLNEAVTQSKLIKMNGKLKKMVEADPSMKKRLLELDMNDDSSVKPFIDEVFGEPTGLYKNTYEEQKKVLRRMYDDYHAEQGSMFRPEFGEIGVDA